MTEILLFVYIILVLIKVILLASEKLLIIVGLPMLLNTIYSLLGVVFTDIKNLETYLYLVYYETVCLCILAFFCFNKSILINVQNVIKSVELKFNNRITLCLSVIFLIAILSLLTLFPQFYSNARDFYVELHTLTSQNALSFFIALSSLLLATFAVNFFLAIDIFFVLLLTGSKGLAVQPLLNYIIFMRITSRRTARMILFLCVAVFLIYFAVDSLHKGVDNPLLWLTRNYFDYIQNLDVVSSHNVILPNQFWAGAINDLIPGLLKIIGNTRDEYSQYFFPYDYENGKNPGLLDYEQINRLGFILYIPYIIIYWATIISCASIVRRIFKGRYVLFVLYALLFIYQNIRLFVFLLMLLLAHSIISKLLKKECTHVFSKPHE